MSNEDVLSLNLQQIQRETITVDGVEYPVVKWRSLELLTFYTGKTNLSILQDVLISSKLNMLNTLNNFNLFFNYKAFHLGGFFLLYYKLEKLNLLINKTK
jgi:hypothetical protein